MHTLYDLLFQECQSMKRTFYYCDLQYHAVIFILYRVGRGQADVCVQCLLQIAMKSSPHLDWVVAHIG